MSRLLARACAALPPFAAVGLLAGAAVAADCGGNWGGGGNVPGTLASPAQPCRPQRGPTPHTPPDTRPGTFTQGNTTVHVGGSISTDMGIGAGSGRR
jgi:hypothetical protein